MNIRQRLAFVALLWALVTWLVRATWHPEDPNAWLPGDDLDDYDHE